MEGEDNTVLVYSSTDFPVQMLKLIVRGIFMVVSCKHQEKSGFLKVDESVSEVGCKLA